ncbi:hypothetical protein ACFTAO_16765 [Paenibacillus rhizoplanae]
MSKRVGRELKHGEKISIYDIEQVVYRHLQQARVRVHVSHNALSVYIQSRSADPSCIPVIREEIRACIPEIGLMIANHLLDDIEVILTEEDEELIGGQVKNKKTVLPERSNGAAGSEAAGSGTDGGAAAYQGYIIGYRTYTTPEAG